MRSDKSDAPTLNELTTDDVSSLTVKLMNEKLDDLRRQLVREAESEDAKGAIKGTRWLLLYRRDNLPQSKARQLEKALEMNRPLATAYLLKEELALAWEQGSWEAMAEFCCAWCQKASATGIDQLMSMALALTDHAEWILGYTTTGMTNGRMEGINPQRSRDRCSRCQHALLGTL